MAADRLRRAEQAVDREAQQAQSEKYNSAITVGTTLLGALFGRKTISAKTLGGAGSAAKSMSRARKEASDVRRSEEALDTTNAKARTETRPCVPITTTAGTATRPVSTKNC